MRERETNLEIYDYDEIDLSNLTPEEMEKVWKIIELYDALDKIDEELDRIEDEKDELFDEMDRLGDELDQECDGISPEVQDKIEKYFQKPMERI